MITEKHLLLSINAGSSSLKFSVFEKDGLERRLEGRIDRIGGSDSVLVYSENGPESVKEVSVPTHKAAEQVLLEFLSKTINLNDVIAIGHRVVYGMGRNHSLITPSLINDLRETISLDPEHLPFEIELMELFADAMPDIAQVACFDSVFHNEMPRVAKTLSIPRRFENYGIQRYGFHGLSYAYLSEELGRIDPGLNLGRVIVAHLGNGASVTAIQNGKSIDTSMGFSPTSGIPMSSRTGDVDPGALLFAMQKEEMTLQEATQLIHQESGLIGISGTSADMKTLLELESSDYKAKEAVDFFCYQVKKTIGAYAAVLGGVNSLVFTGGIGENASKIRARICEGLQFLGIEIDDDNNQRNEPLISSNSSRVIVRVMHTDEEIMIARITRGLVLPS